MDRQPHTQKIGDSPARTRVLERAPARLAEAQMERAATTVDIYGLEVMDAAPRLDSTEILRGPRSSVPPVRTLMRRIVRQLMRRLTSLRVGLAIEDALTLWLSRETFGSARRRLAALAAMPPIEIANSKAQSARPPQASSDGDVTKTPPHAEAQQDYEMSPAP